MLVLGLESSAVAASCALCEVDGEKSLILAENFINTKRTHSQTLLPMVENMLKCAEIELNDVDVFAAASGPGSFTGVRIGVSLAKGMAFALNKPCKGVSSLHSSAYNLAGFEGIVCAVMDARCSQFYNALFRSEKGGLKRLTEDRAISAENLSRELQDYDERIIFVGDGACLARELIGNQKIEVAPLALRFQRASSVCAISAEYDQISAKELLPVYLRMPQAERERLAREENSRS